MLFFFFQPLHLPIDLQPLFSNISLLFAHLPFNIAQTPPFTFTSNFIQPIPALFSLSTSHCFIYTHVLPFYTQSLQVFLHTNFVSKLFLSTLFSPILFSFPETKFLSSQVIRHSTETAPLHLSFCTHIN